MEAGVITPKTGVGINGKNSGGELADKEKQNGEVEWGSYECNFAYFKTIYNPASGNNRCHGIDKNHFVELKNFGREWPQEKGGYEK